MTHHSRFTRAVVVGSSAEDHTIDLRILSYDTVDSYGTVWLRGSVDETLADGYLPLAWSHQWTEPVGKMVERLPDDDLGPVVRFQLDDFDDVPMARQIYSQLKSGTLRDCSIGFSGWNRSDPSSDEAAQWPGAKDIVSRVSLDEVSVVLRGAVPSAELVGIRDETAVVDEDIDVSDLEEDIDVSEAIDYSKLEASVDAVLNQLGQ